MKRVVATILSVLYLATSSGATIDVHYCMGKLIGWNFASAADSKCSNCGMTKENKKGCCNDKHQTFGVKKDQLAASINFVPDNTFQYVVHYYNNQVNTYILPGTIDSPSVNSPPGKKPIPAFILYCVFRI